MNTLRPRVSVQVTARYLISSLCLMVGSCGGANDEVKEVEILFLNEKLPMIANLGVPTIVDRTPQMERLLADKVRAKRILIEILRLRRSPKAVAMAAFCLGGEFNDLDTRVFTDELKYWEKFKPQSIETVLACSELCQAAKIE